MTMDERLEALEEKVVVLQQEQVRLLERLMYVELHGARTIGTGPGGLRGPGNPLAPNPTATRFFTPRQE